MYIFLYCLFCINSLIHEGRTNEKRVSMFPFFTLLLMVYGLRSTKTGWDNTEYHKVFGYGLSNIVSWFEPGYMLLSRAVYVVTHSYIAFQFVAGIILLYGIIRFLKSSSKNVYMSMFLWFTFGMYFNYMNQVRQNLSTIIGISAVMMWRKSRFLAAVLSLLAMTFHMGGVVYPVFLILLCIINEKPERLKKLGLVFIPVTGCFLVSDTVFQNILSRLPVAKIYIERFKMLGYLGRGHYRFAIFYTGILILVMLLYRKCGKQTQAENIPYLLGTFVTVFFAYMSIVVNMIQRSTSCFLPLVTVCLSNMLTESRMLRSSRRIVKAGVYILMTAYMLYYLYASNMGKGIDGVTPYAFFWEEG